METLINIIYQLSAGLDFGVLAPCVQVVQKGRLTGHVTRRDVFTLC